MAAPWSWPIVLWLDAGVNIARVLRYYQVMGKQVPPIERVLIRARRDPEFRRELMSRRGDAAKDAGLELSESEQTMLASVGSEQLGQMLDALPLQSRRVAMERPPKDLMRCTSLGIRLDMPPERLDGSNGFFSGCQPDISQPPSVPAEGRIRGSRPSIPIALTAGAVLAVGAGAAISGTMLSSGGARPDVPPPQSSAEDAGMDADSGTRPKDRQP